MLVAARVRRERGGRVWDVELLHGATRIASYQGVKRLAVGGSLVDAERFAEELKGSEIFIDAEQVIIGSDYVSATPLSAPIREVAEKMERGARLLYRP